MTYIPSELKSTTEIRNYLRTGRVVLDPLTDSEKINLIQDNNINTLELRVPQRIYTAFINQSTTDNPEVIVFENTVGNIVWRRTDAGKYTGNLPTVFLMDKIVVVTPCGTSYVSPPFLDDTCYTFSIKRVHFQNYFEISIETYNTEILSDDVLNNTFIEIRVYDAVV